MCLEPVMRYRRYQKLSNLKTFLNSNVFTIKRNGLGNKIADLESILIELDPGLMFFCKTYVFEESEIHIDKYQGFYCNKLNSKTNMKNQSRGGVCIYGRDHLNITLIADNCVE